MVTQLPCGFQAATTQQPEQARHQALLVLCIALRPTFFLPAGHSLTCTAMMCDAHKYNLEIWIPRGPFARSLLDWHMSCGQLGLNDPATACFCGFARPLVSICTALWLRTYLVGASGSSCDTMAVLSAGRICASTALCSMRTSVSRGMPSPGAKCAPLPPAA